MISNYLLWYLTNFTCPNKYNIGNDQYYDVEKNSFFEHYFWIFVLQIELIKPGNRDGEPFQRNCQEFRNILIKELDSLGYEVPEVLYFGRKLQKRKLDSVTEQTILLLRSNYYVLFNNLLNAYKYNYCSYNDWRIIRKRGGFCFSPNKLVIDNRQDILKAGIILYNYYHPHALINNVTPKKMLEKLTNRGIIYNMSSLYGIENIHDPSKVIRFIIPAKSGSKPEYLFNSCSNPVLPLVTTIHGLRGVFGSIHTLLNFLERLDWNCNINRLRELPCSVYVYPVCGYGINYSELEKYSPRICIPFYGYRFRKDLSEFWNHRLIAYLFVLFLWSTIILIILETFIDIITIINELELELSKQIPQLLDHIFGKIALVFVIIGLIANLPRWKISFEMWCKEKGYDGIIAKSVTYFLTIISPYKYIFRFIKRWFFVKPIVLDPEVPQ